MTDIEAYELIGNRAKELAEFPEMRAKMLSIARQEGKDAAVKYLYMFAIGTLAGVNIGV